MQIYRARTYQKNKRKLQFLGYAKDIIGFKARGSNDNVCLLTLKGMQNHTIQPLIAQTLQSCKDAQNIFK